jgi:hypothetical protein
VTRQDLSPGYQLVQSVHAAIDFILAHPKEAKEWHLNSNYLGCLAAKDEQSLKDLIAKLEENGIKHTVFREPDIDNHITAIAIEPGDITRKLTSRFPLALNMYNAGINKHNLNTTAKSWWPQFLRAS